MLWLSTYGIWKAAPELVRHDLVAKVRWQTGCRRHFNPVAERSHIMGTIIREPHMRENREDIIIDGNICAIVIRAEYDRPGIQFFTDSKYSQQLASMSYQPGKIIPAHTHNAVRREVFYTQETLFVRKGKVRVDLYSEAREYRTSRVLGPGDVILLISGGHGFEVLEELNMIEVKQGPYAGQMDKSVLASVCPKKVKIEE
jgi:mannose-6-phosphate isomerase-like protein (cupin superfamily)